MVFDQTEQDCPMRLLHTMLRVGNMQRSIDFYTQVLGMKLLRTTERSARGMSLPLVPLCLTGPQRWAVRSRARQVRYRVAPR